MNGKFPSDKRKPKPVFLHDLSRLGLDFFGAVLIYTSIVMLQCSWRVDSLRWGKQDKRVAEDVRSETHISLSCTLNWFTSLQQEKKDDNSDFFIWGSGGAWLQSWETLAVWHQIFDLGFFKKLFDFFKQNQNIIPVLKSALVITTGNEHYRETYMDLIHLKHFKYYSLLLLFTDTSANNFNSNLKIWVYQILCYVKLPSLVL